jgi:coenzyme F420-reducing hydrogenase beta subunit
MKEDAIGHIFPCIDEEKCINCGLCKRICPGNHNFTLNNPKNVYAAWSLNEHEHETCSSGGIATFLSRKVLETGGVVYGCSSVFNKEDQVIHHIRIDSLTDLHLLRGSKYVHSYIGKCYTHAKNDLENGRQVVFVGTPCQIAGLDAFLQKNIQIY